MKLDRVPSVDVSVRCGGAALREHWDEADTRDDESVGVSYIEAASGSNFTVLFQATNFKHGKWPSVALETKLDGKVIYTTLLDPSSSPMYRDDLQDDADTDRAKFADFKNIGEIEINVYACRRTGQSGREEKRSIASMSNSSVPEKALKGRAISNRATLGTAEPATKTVSWLVEYENEPRKPFATSIFKYRSRRDLQIEGLIPRSPSPRPLEERDLDDLSPEEMRQLLRQKRAEESKPEVKVKKEKRRRATEDEDGSDDEVTITEERSKRARQSTDSGVEIIDLTDD